MNGDIIAYIPEVENVIVEIEVVLNPIFLEQRLKTNGMNLQAKNTE